MGKIVAFGARNSVEQQAREWLIRLDGDTSLSEEERQRLREWMSQSPLHREELTRIARFWNQANILTELTVSVDAPQKRPLGASRRLLALATGFSGLLVAIALTWWGLHRWNEPVIVTYETRIGQQMTVPLPDGSSIQLNTNSQVEVDYTSAARNINLLRGEALFSVTPDPRRPFEVQVADTIVRAVGTAFTVHFEGGSVNVTVSKGVVDVAESVGKAATPTSDSSAGTTAASQKLGRVREGEMTQFNNGSRQIEIRQLAAPELQRRMAWREGYLAFSGEPLSEVVEQVNRYSLVRLEIADPGLAATAIGGRFKIGDLEAVLDVLHTNFGIQARRLSETNIRLESDRAP